MVADEFLEKSYPKKTILRHLGLSRSSYYYKPTGTKAGKRVEKLVYKKRNDNDGHYVEKQFIIDEIKLLLE